MEGHPVSLAEATETIPETIRVVIADADPLARGALADLVRDGGLVVTAQAADATETVELARHYRPDVLVADIAMLADDACSLTQRLCDVAPDVAIVALTMGAGDEDPIAVLRAGASAVIEKTLNADVLTGAIETVASGQAVVEPRVAKELIERMRAVPVAGQGFRPIRGPLTNREWEIVEHLIAEATTKEIASDLYLTEDTVYGYVKSIMRKLGAHSRAEAVDAVQRLYALELAA
jgi:DNA-binding NarL/FixJ family response regulator